MGITVDIVFMSIDTIIIITDEQRAAGKALRDLGYSPDERLFILPVEDKPGYFNLHDSHVVTAPIVGQLVPDHHGRYAIRMSIRAEGAYAGNDWDSDTPFGVGVFTADGSFYRDAEHAFEAAELWLFDDAYIVPEYAFHGE